MSKHARWEIIRVGNALRIEGPLDESGRSRIIAKISDDSIWRSQLTHAYLIAAAPEMFDKLVEIHEFEHGSDGACECDLHKLIKKAEGKTE